MTTPTIQQDQTDLLATILELNIEDIRENFEELMLTVDEQEELEVAR